MQDHKSIPTNLFLHNIHISFDGFCCRCGLFQESILHLLRDWSHARRIWSQLNIDVLQHYIGDDRSCWLRANNINVPKGIFCLLLLVGFFGKVETIWFFRTLLNKIYWQLKNQNFTLFDHSVIGIFNVNIISCFQWCSFFSHSLASVINSIPSFEVVTLFLTNILSERQMHVRIRKFLFLFSELPLCFEI